MSYNKESAFVWYERSLNVISKGRGFFADVRAHSSEQLELKNHYPLTSSRIDRYVLDAWIYTPVSLGINTKDYGVQRFLSDVKCLTRFSATCIPLSRLIDPDCEVSPIARIRSELTSAILSQDIRSKKVIYELRSLANIYSSETNASESIIADAVKNGRITLVKDTIKQNLKDIKDFLDCWRSLYGLFLNPTVNSSLREAYVWTDESISLTTEHVLFELYRQIEPDDESPSLIRRIRKLMGAELTHRKTMGYHTVSSEATEKDAERRIYRESTLKKWSQSVLYLSQEESGTGRRVGHLMAGVAAAAAMSFAVIATILAERFFPGHNFTWAVAIIIAYIFKDRIKEILRDILKHTLPGLVIDQRVHLVDQASGRKVGAVKSRVRFLRARDAPSEVERLRSLGSNRFRQILPEEDLIHFRREIVIHNGRLRDAHTRLENLSDIIRFKLGSMLTNMDDPVKTIPTFATETPMEISGNRVYHINLIIRLARKSGGAVSFSRYRLSMSRTGLVRIDPLVKPSYGNLKA